MTISIFISYSRKDESAKELIQLLDERVKQLKVDATLVNGTWKDAFVWWDKRIPAGQDWWEDILNEIQSCTHFVYLLSEPSLSSKFCQTEHKWAREINRRMFYIKTDRGIRENLLPRDINRKQIIPFSQDKKVSVDEIIDAISNVPNNPPKPPNINTMPRPECPQNPFAELAEKINNFDEKRDAESVIYGFWHFLRDAQYRDDAIYLAKLIERNLTETKYREDVLFFLQEAQRLHSETQTPLKDTIKSVESKKTLESQKSLESTTPHLSRSRNDIEIDVKSSYPKSPIQFMNIWHEFKGFLDNNEEIHLDEIANRFELPITTKNELAAELVRNSNFFIDFLVYTNKIAPNLGERLYNIYTTTKD